MPGNDAERVAVLHALDMADRPMPPESQQIVELVAHIFEVSTRSTASAISSMVRIMQTQLSYPGTVLPAAGRRLQLLVMLLLAETCSQCC